MTELLTMSLLPDLRILPVINSGLASICNMTGTTHDILNRLQLASEEVFSYCVKTIMESGGRERVTLRIMREGDLLMVILEYAGVRGELSRYFRTGSKEKPEYRSFEAMGLVMAWDVLDELSYDFWPNKGINRFLLSIDVTPQAAAKRRSKI